MESFHGVTPFIWQHPGREHVRPRRAYHGYRPLAVAAGVKLREAESARRCTGFASGGASGRGRYFAPYAVPFAASHSPTRGRPLMRRLATPETLSHTRTPPARG